MLLIMARHAVHMCGYKKKVSNPQLCYMEFITRLRFLSNGGIRIQFSMYYNLLITMWYYFCGCIYVVCTIQDGAAHTVKGNVCKPNSDLSMKHLERKTQAHINKSS